MATAVGQITEIWRYPVSSVGGEQLTHVTLGKAGVPGDRSHALVDTETGLPAAPEKEIRWRKCLFLKAHSRPDEIPHIGFPDDRWYGVDDPELEAELTDYFGFRVAVRPYAPGDGQTGALAVNRYVPSPLHVVTSASLRQLATLCPTAEIDQRRFRPTLFVTTDGAEGFVETRDWIGRRLAFGAVQSQITEGAKRCGITLSSQPGLGEDPNILRTIVRHNRHKLGVYGSIEVAGECRVGDTVFLLDPGRPDILPHAPAA